VFRHVDLEVLSTSGRCAVPPAWYIQTRLSCEGAVGFMQGSVCDLETAS
jgi:hypothetical protein